jgi:ABC-type multidrug transport system fused ATPase/permease subunit
MSLSATVLMGVVGATVMFLGARQIVAGTLTLGGFMSFTAFLAFLVAPMLPGGGHRHATHRGAGRAGPHAGSAARAARGRRPAPHRAPSAPSTAIVVFDRVTFAYDAGKPVLHDVSFVRRPAP